MAISNRRKGVGFVSVGDGAEAAERQRKANLLKANALLASARTGAEIEIAKEKRRDTI